jgi:hypothetical protein
MTAAPVEPRPRPADELVRRYEAVRRPAGSGTGDNALGRALMMHQGVAAWIGAWANCRATPAPPLEGVPCGGASAGGRPSAADVLPPGVRGQVARVLTGMAVAGLRDRRS